MDETLHQLGAILLRALEQLRRQLSRRPRHSRRSHRRQAPAWESGVRRSAVWLALLFGLVCSIPAQERPPADEPARRTPTWSIRQAFLLRLGEPEAGDESAGVHEQSNGAGRVSQLCART